MADKGLSTGEIKSHFDQNASQYESMTGGVTRRIAAVGLEYIGPLTSSSHILDSACGPGVVTRLILETTAKQGINPPPHITAIDFAPGMIDQVELNKKAYKWTTVDSKVMNAQSLKGLEDNTFDAIIMNFGIFALPDAAEGAKEMLRVLKPGGTVVATTWKESGAVVVLEDVVGSIRPDCVGRIFPLPKEWLKAEKLRDVLHDGGFKAETIKVFEVQESWVNSSVKEFVDALSGPFWEKTMEGWTDEEKAKWRPEVEKRAKLNEQESGQVFLPCIAWMGVATK